MISLKVKYDDKEVFYNNITYLNLSDLPFVSFEMDGIPEIKGFEVTDSVVSFSVNYVRDHEFINFKFDSDAGGVEFHEFNV